MDKPTPVADKPLCLEDFNSIAKTTTKRCFSEAVGIIDSIFGVNYAMKNPQLVQVISRIYFDEFCVLRAREGALRKKSV